MEVSLTEEVIRYKNRRLYSKLEKEYVNLKHIKDALKLGRVVKVIQKETGEDITEKVLKQASK